MTRKQGAVNAISLLPRLSCLTITVFPIIVHSHFGIAELFQM